MKAIFFRSNTSKQSDVHFTLLDVVKYTHIKVCLTVKLKTAVKTDQLLLGLL